MAKIKAYELRSQEKAELEEKLKELKGELQALRVAKVTGGAPNKLAKIKIVKKGIARVLTVINQETRKGLRESLSKKRYLPTDLRQKKTRALRRTLTKAQLSAKTERQKKKDAAFPQRKYAVKA